MSTDSRIRTQLRRKILLIGKSVKWSQREYDYHLQKCCMSERKNEREKHWEKVRTTTTVAREHLIIKSPSNYTIQNNVFVACLYLFWSFIVAVCFNFCTGRVHNITRYESNQACFSIILSVRLYIILLCFCVFTNIRWNQQSPDRYRYLVISMFRILSVCECHQIKCVWYKRTQQLSASFHSNSFRGLNTY